ncbi:MAG: MBL fold metallo-hydrolase [Candidatus Hydrogenedens sp.]|nr:MBL fold metallo-hydrolase [Candidatus Hydrogenedens sp.]
MICFSVLGSGSSGNATYIQSSCHSILLDCGFSLPQIKKRMEYLGRDISDLDAILITHEHTDHVCGLKRLLSICDIPVFMTRGTYCALQGLFDSNKNIEIFESGDSIAVGDIYVQSFAVTHDAGDPVNYVISHSGVRVGFATDCGYPSKLMINKLKGCHGLIVESNYCPDMLINGPYPAHLKQRIKGRYGHLSNQQMLQIVSEVMDEALRVLVLAHISENNNHPEIVARLVRETIGSRDIQLWITNQTHPTPLIHLS